MAEPTSFTSNILGVTDLVESPINKITSSGNINPEGVASDKIDVLDLPEKDEYLLSLRDEWESIYSSYESKIIPIFKRNLRSYLGRLKDGSLLDENQPGAANL